MANNFGTVQHGGKTIHLTEAAYFSDTLCIPPTYEARGVDDGGDTYLVLWDILDQFWSVDDNGNIAWPAYDPDCPQEEDALCDWNTPVSVDLVR